MSQDNFWYPISSSNNSKNPPLVSQSSIYNPLNPPSDIQFQQFDYGANNQPSPVSQNPYSIYTPAYQGQIFNPNENKPVAANFNNYDDMENEPPLLEELGIDFKTISVLNPFKKSMNLENQNDLAGPLLFCLLFGTSLLMAGKVHFGYIYGISGLGSLSMYCLLNLMSPLSVSYLCIISVLGYSLLPIILLSSISVFFHLSGFIGTILILSSVLWCAISASKMFVDILKMSSQQLLIVYPCALLYGVFALLAVF